MTRGRSASEGIGSRYLGLDIPAAAFRRTIEFGARFRERSVRYEERGTSCRIGIHFNCCLMVTWPWQVNKSCLLYCAASILSNKAGHTRVKETCRVVVNIHFPSHSPGSISHPALHHE